jgi:hypothetical protein
MRAITGTICYHQQQIAINAIPRVRIAQTQAAALVLPAIQDIISNLPLGTQRAQRLVQMDFIPISSLKTLRKATETTRLRPVVPAVQHIMELCPRIAQAVLKDTSSLQTLREATVFKLVLLDITKITRVRPVIPAVQHIMELCPRIAQAVLKDTSSLKIPQEATVFKLALSAIYLTTAQIYV